MWKFLRKLFSEKDGEITVVVIDVNDPDSSGTFKIKSFDIVKFVGSVVVISIAFTIVLLFMTPLSVFYQNQIDQQFRDEVIAINQRVDALQDSLYAREVQLNDLKQFIRTVPDTTDMLNRSFIREDQPVQANTWNDPPMIFTYEMLNQNEIITSTSLTGTPEFPTFYPIEGTITQQFSSEDKHYGIDIAANRNTEFRSIADGTVVNTGWIINYGYVIYVQHSNGIISVYKHGVRLLKEQGDVVLKGDFLGLIGNSGILSSGSHLHLEIWKNGVPQNPLMYLMD